MTDLALQLLRAGQLAILADRERGAFFDDTPEYAAADAVCEALWADYHALRDQLPEAPSSFADIVARAVVAYVGANHGGADGWTLTDLEDGDCASKPAAELIRAVLQLAAIDPATEASNA